MLMFKKAFAVLLGIAAIAAAGILYGLHEQQETLPLDAADQQSAEQQEITVYVSGAVSHPGVISLPDGARVADAVNACGGVLPTADPDALNMAQPLKDGMQIRVVQKTAAQNGAAGTAAVSRDGLVNINTADEKALDSLPGIGPAMAKRIIEYRSVNGSFQKLEDLKKVKGIGEAKFARLKDKVSL